jgi:hypothetical protein
MTEVPVPPLPASFHVLLRAAGAGDFKRAGTVRLETVPTQGSAIAIECEGRRLRGVVTTVIIPPGCDEHCVGTVFLEEI